MATIEPIKKRHQRIEVNAYDYEAYLDFIASIRRAEMELTNLAELEKAVVEAINELDRVLKG
jgi:hypothetical protein